MLWTFQQLELNFFPFASSSSSLPFDAQMNYYQLVNHEQVKGIEMFRFMRLFLGLIGEKEIDRH